MSCYHWEVMKAEGGCITPEEAYGGFGGREAVESERFT